MLAQVAGMIGDVVGWLMDAHLLSWLCIDHNPIIIGKLVGWHSILTTNTISSHFVNFTLVQIESRPSDLLESHGQVLGLNHQVHLLVLVVDFLAHVVNVLCHCELVLAVLPFQLLIQLLALLVLHIQSLYQLVVTTVVVLLYLIESKLDSLSLGCLMALSSQLVGIELRWLSHLLLLLLLLSFEEIQMLGLLLIVCLVLLGLIDGRICLLHHITIHVIALMVTPYHTNIHLLLLIV
jgi:hypothetical protein